MIGKTKAKSFGGGRPGGLFKRIRRKKCRLCMDGQETVDYKDVEFLKNYVTERSKIIPRRVTGACAKHQRVISRSLKKSREAGLLAYISE